MIDDITTVQLTAILGRVFTWGNRISATMLVIGAVILFLAPELGTAVLRAGLVTLLAIPVARVVVLIVGFLRAREWPSALMSGTVLAILMGSVIVALNH
jgi:uncharacterized membrane protein